MTLPWHCQVTIRCDEITLSGRLTQELPACYDWEIQEPAELAGLTFVQKDGRTQLQYGDLERSLENGLPTSSVFRILINGLEQWQRQTLSLSHGGETERVYVGNYEGNSYTVTVATDGNRPIRLQTESGWLIQMQWE